MGEASNTTLLAAAGAAVLAGILALPFAIIMLAGSSAGVPSPGEPDHGGDGRDANAAEIPDEYVDFVTEAGTRCPDLSIDAPVIAAQIDAESGWDPNAESPVGAQGLAQFMPATWTAWGYDHNQNGTTSPLEPADAIGSQADYMCFLADWVAEKVQLSVIGGDELDLALAAYNAGPGAVEEHAGVPPYTETQGYISTIRELIPQYSAADDPSEDDGGGGDGGSESRSAVVNEATQWLGYPYVWGGGDLSGPTGIGRDGRGPGFDCSGLTRYAIYHALDVDIGRPADAQARDEQGQEIYIGPGAGAPWGSLEAGDIIGFSDSGGLNYQHIGIYMGDGQMVHAPQTGSNVEIIDLQSDTSFAGQNWQIRRFG